MKEKTIKVSGKEYRISPVEGEINRGELEVTSVSINMSGEEMFVTDFSEPQPWGEVENAVLNVLIEERVEDEENLCCDDWETTRYINEGTQRMEVLIEIVENHPTTTSIISDSLGEGVSVGSAVYGLKDQGLIECIGKDGRKDIFWPTARGVKEASAQEGMDNIFTKEKKTGLDSFFDNVEEGSTED